MEHLYPAKIATKRKQAIRLDRQQLAFVAEI